ncbi:MAG: hypothetical protein OJF50_005302 [Nitrospira sp.]|nr:hypothetical protein [Nitrospira sp.]
MHHESGKPRAAKLVTLPLALTLAAMFYSGKEQDVSLQA